MLFQCKHSAMNVLHVLSWDAQREMSFNFACIAACQTTNQTQVGLFFSTFRNKETTVKAFFLVDLFPFAQQFPKIPTDLSTSIFKNNLEQPALQQNFETHRTELHTRTTTCGTYTANLLFLVNYTFCIISPCIHKVHA